jgi:regulator of replication initiation timing
MSLVEQLCALAGDDDSVDYLVLYAAADKIEELEDRNAELYKRWAEARLRVLELQNENDELKAEVAQLRNELLAQTNHLRSKPTMYYGYK